MRRQDRPIARAHRHLRDGETVVASAVGREIEGRRGRVVLVTDRRIVVAWTRAAPPDVLPLRPCTASFDSPNGVLRLEAGTESISLRDVDPHSARCVVECLSQADLPPLRERIGQPFRVRIVSS